MLAKRIIPCLDVKDGMTVKGVNFVNLRSAGDPVELGKRYSDEGADELVYLDITASYEHRKTFIDLVRRVAQAISIPFTVGGGIGSVADVDRLLSNGADKVSVNSAALNRPQLIDEIARQFGRQVCVVAIDARFTDGQWVCYEKGGRVKTGRTLYEWAHEAQERGAGEILFTSMDHDGTKNGYACDALRQLHQQLQIPIIYVTDFRQDLFVSQIKITMNFHQILHCCIVFFLQFFPLIFYSNIHTFQRHQ